MNPRGSPVEGSGVPEETRGERDEVLERVLRHRERHRELSVFARGSVVAAGGTVSIFAGLLSVIAPELGLPLLLIGLRLLALELDWAARAYVRVARLVGRVGERLRKLIPLPKRGVFLAVVAATVAVVVPLVWAALP